MTGLAMPGRRFGGRFGLVGGRWAWDVVRGDQGEEKEVERDEEKGGGGKGFGSHNVKIIKLIEATDRMVWAWGRRMV